MNLKTLSTITFLIVLLISPTFCMAGEIPVSQKTVRKDEKPNKAGVQSFIPKNSRQAIIVLSDNWSNLRSKMYLCSKQDSSWQLDTESFPAVIGKKGLAWGIGVHGDKSIGSNEYFASKKEGDLRSPAGIFTIGKCFGYAAKPPFDMKIEYEQILSTYHGVDDTKSKYYNQILDTSKLEGDYKQYWKSHELMKRKDDLYKWLFIINHNPDNIPGNGSLIFLHLWRNKDKGTAGCTAIDEDNFLKLMHWIDKSKNPIIIQLTYSSYEWARRQCGLPEITNPKN